jgi:hypothetical protein|tara:strand:- start:2024 stop:2206 length:183 start_codon:yes stop_codon:yes gene_type:complete
MSFNKDVLLHKLQDERSKIKDVLSNLEQVLFELDEGMDFYDTRNNLEDNIEKLKLIIRES